MTKQGRIRVGRWLVGALMLALVGTGLAAYRLDILVPWYDHFIGDPPSAAPSSPAEIPAPAGLELPPVPQAGDVAEPLPDATAPLARRRVSAALAPHLADPVLGPRVLAAVADLDSGEVVARSGPGRAIPASLTKLVTGLAALSALGPERTFETTVVAGGQGRVVLVGGGDPYLMAEDLATLAEATAEALRTQGRRRVSLGYDASLFTGPSFNPAWPASYADESVVSPITALWVDQGRVPGSFSRVANPALSAAQTFAAALREAGIRVRGAPAAGVAGGGRVLASLESPPVRLIVQRVIEVSDNEAAEVLLHHIGLATSSTGSFDAGVEGALTTLAGLGVDTGGIEIYDGSGLSRRNLIAPEALLEVLRTAATGDAGLRLLLDGLPVSGFNGTLASRFDQAFPEARGQVRAKTGTLTAVSSLAGFAVDQQGHEMVFVLMADRIDRVVQGRAQDALDRAAGALGACRCGRIAS